MIISFLRRFIFLKTKKTGGTSVEVALSAFCGPEDILTPIGFDDERLRSPRGEAVARNYADAVIEERLRLAFSRGNQTDWHSVMKQLPRLGHFYNHIPARLAFARLDPRFVSDAYKFTVVRHPYERAVSAAYYRCWYFHRPVTCFPDELQKVIVGKDHGDQNIYRIGGRIAVDEILRQETLEDDLRRVFVRLGLNAPAQFPRSKASIRPDRRPAREILSDSQKEILYKRFRATFDLGYEL